MVEEKGNKGTVARRPQKMTCRQPFTAVGESVTLTDPRSHLRKAQQFDSGKYNKLCPKKRENQIRHDTKEHLSHHRSLHNALRRPTHNVSPASLACSTIGSSRLGSSLETIHVTTPIQLLRHSTHFRSDGWVYTLNLRAVFHLLWSIFYGPPFIVHHS